MCLRFTFQSFSVENSVESDETMEHFSYDELGDKVEGKDAQKFEGMIVIKG